MATEPRSGLSPALARAGRVAIPLLVVATVVALRPEILTGTFSSVTSVLKVVAVVAAWVGFSWLLRRFVHEPVARTAIMVAVGGGLLWFTVVPYFHETTVDDAFPTVTAPTVAPTPTAAAPAAPAAPVVTTVAPVAPAPAGPQRLAAGQLRGLAGHHGAGDAAIYRQPDGSLVVRLEGFDVSSVPKPVVYLVPGTGQQRPGGVKLGDLRGSNGNQNFAVAAGTDVSGPQTILIWCEAFSVPVASATATAS